MIKNDDNFNIEKSSDEWKLLNTSSCLSSEQKFWIAILELAMKDWIKFKKYPSNRSYQDAKTVIDWPNHKSFDLVASAVSSIYKEISEESFKKAFIKWMGQIPKWEPKIPLLWYTCNLCNEYLEEEELEDHMIEFHSNVSTFNIKSNYTIV